MARKNNQNTQQIARPKDMNAFRETVHKMKEDGFVPMPLRRQNETHSQTEWEKVVSSAGIGEGGASGKKGASYISATSKEMGEDLKLGTNGLGWMAWGADNKLPNNIASLTEILPYTATGWKFNSDVTAGLGPRPKYRYTQYTPGIGIKTREIDYDAAGPMIRQRIMDLRKELMALKLQIATDNSSSDLTKMIEEDIAELENDYSTWKRTMEGIQTFMENTDTKLLLLQLACEFHLTGMCFPEVRLSSDVDVQTQSWKPKVTGLGFYSCWKSRLERRDKDDRINYLYISNKWLEGKTAEKEDISVLPLLDPMSPGYDLKQRLVDIRTENQLKPGKRPTRYVIPVAYPSPGHPYYTQPSWYSIFGGNIYEYASTIISDRAIRRKNSNIIGRVIYVHTGYLEQVFIQRNAQTSEEKQAIFDEIVSEVNAFLRDPENSGESLFAYSFIGNDGKEHESYRIVEIPASNKNSADANKTELEEVCNILFFAQGLQPSLIGAVPGHSGSSGGTYQREMLLIKQLLLSPTQSLLLKPFEVVSTINEWDKKLVWRVQQMALTTLDNSKTGMTEQETN